MDRENLFCCFAKRSISLPDSYWYDRQFLKSMIKGNKLYPLDSTMASRFDRLSENYQEIF